MNEPDQATNTTESNDDDGKDGRRKLSILFAIAFVPIFIAYGVFFYAPSLMPTGTTNNGVLISPPINTGVQGEHWTMYVAIPADCDAACQKVLIDTRQIHIALGKEAPRVLRKIVTAIEPDAAFQEDIKENHQHTDLVVDPVLMARLTGIVNNPNVVFIMDPLGNVMMYFADDKIGKPLLKDIKHLLKLSNIG